MIGLEVKANPLDFVCVLSGVSTYMKWIFYVLVGMAGGVLAGMGMGGGTLTIPLLVLLLGVEQTVAQTVNLVAFLPTGAVALGVHMKNKLVVLDKVLFLLVPAFCASVLSSIFATDLEGEVLSKLFGGFLILTSIVSFSLSTFKK